MAEQQLAQPTYSVKYVGVVNGRVGVFSRRVQGRGTGHPLPKKSLNELKPNPLLERLLKSKKLHNQPPIRVLRLKREPSRPIVHKPEKSA